MTIGALAKMVPVFTTRGAINDKEEKAFESGRELGYEEGVEEAFQIKFELSEGMSEQEDLVVQHFLTKNNIAICYDKFNGGLRLRKFKVDPSEARAIADEILERRKKFHNIESDKYV